MRLAHLIDWVAEGGSGRPSSRGMRLLMAISPFWLVLAQLRTEFSPLAADTAFILLLFTLGLSMLQGVLQVLRGGVFRDYLRRHLLAFGFLVVEGAVVGLAAAGWLPWRPVAAMLLGLDLVGRGFVVLTGGGRGSPPPATVMAISFLVLIAGGTLALLSPGATVPKHPLSLEDAFFTATSAVCVTGLTVVDMGTRLSSQGQVIVLGLIQLGGLGLMTLGAFVLIFLDTTQKARGESLIGSLLGTRHPGELLQVAGSIAGLTALIEGAGAAILAVRFHDPWKGVFCSVSAFCNAGFFLEPTSLENYVGDPSVSLTVMALIVLGGLGFPVLLEGARQVRDGFSRHRARKPVSLAARLVVVSTLLLIVGGACSYWLLEKDNSLVGLNGGEQVLASSFQSVTMRTAGFDTVSFKSKGPAAVKPATLLLATGIMSVGASPLGTGGGFKTLTLVVLLLGVMAVARGREEITVGRRRLRSDVMLKAAAVFIVYVLVLFIVIVALMVTDGQRLGLVNLIFEGTSALGTVGLSTGITRALSDGGRLVLCAAMFLGRVGPLTLFLLFSTAHATAVSYPEEDLVVG